MSLLRVVDRDMLKLASRLHINVAKPKPITTMELQSADNIDDENNGYLLTEIASSQLRNDVTVEFLSSGIPLLDDRITAAATAPTAAGTGDNALEHPQEMTDVDGIKSDIVQQRVLVEGDDDVEIVEDNVDHQATRHSQRTTPDVEDLDSDFNDENFASMFMNHEDDTFSIEGEKEISRPLQLCQVCYELEHFEVRPCCAGSVCDLCLRRHAETQLTDVGNIRITCPCVDCKRLVYSTEIRRLLAANVDLLGKYDRWIEAANCQGPHRKTCPRCCRITEVEPSSLSGRKVAKYGIEVRCSDCELEWCFSCLSPAHPGMTCRAVRAGDKLLKRWASDVNVIGGRNARRCPKCKIFIERNGGCDHMVCQQCNTKFCFLCGAKRRKWSMFGVTFEKHDRKYSILGCNGPVRSTRTNLIRGAVFGGKVTAGTVVCAVATPLVVGLAGAALGLAAAVGAVALPVYGTYKLVRLFRPA